LENDQEAERNAQEFSSISNYPASK